MPSGIYINGYSDPPRIPELDLEVKTGELVLLTGGPGSGKSRLVRRLAGIDPPGQAVLSVAGGRPGSQVSKAHSAFLFQEENFDRRREVVQQLVRRLCLRGIHRRKAGRLILDWCRSRGMIDLLHRKPADLNLEQVRLLSLAQVVLWKPLAAVLDEPLANLGVPSREDALGWISSLREHAAVLVAASEPAGLLETADRSVVLPGGPVE